MIGNRLRLPVLLLGVGAVFVGAPAGAAFYWVGNNGQAPCTHATLQSAIVTATLNATEDVIGIVGNVTLPGDLTILPGSGLQITGGVAACGSFTTTTASTISAGTGQRALTIAAGAGEIITLWNVIVTNNNGTYGGDGGAIYFTGASSTSTLRLVHTTVRDSNCLGDGGGLYVNSGRVELQGSTRFVGNSAANGGAIALGAATTGEISLQGAVIESNIAYFDGGGLYAPSGTVDFRGAGAGTPVAFLDNLAGGDGGGLYFGAASLGGFGYVAVVTDPAEIAANRAQRGGGVYVASDQGIAIGNVAVELNQAFGQGGGVYVAPGGAIATAMPAGSPTLGRPLFNGNVATDGKAIFASDGLVSLHTGTITGHLPGAVDSALVTAEGGSEVHLRGMTIHANTAARLVEIRDTSDLFVVFTTVAGNAVDSLLRNLGTSPDVLANSIVAETEALYDSPPSSPPLLTCLVNQYPSMLRNLPPGTGTAGVLTADPRFANAAGGDYHLGVSSPAVDRCFDIPTSLPDADGDPRGVDDSGTANPLGRTYDAGADEANWLFYDGFETGDTSRWSSSSL